MENLSGANIKGYELGERLGAGGFGAVYKARQTTVERDVAIKIIKPGYANQPEFIRRFQAEAQVVARLEHPYITPLYDYWRDPDGAYLVMRWLRGGSLRAALSESPFDLQAAARFMEQITSALATAHRSNVIHRDLKPENILLDEDGNHYLADFGIAKDRELGNSDQTSPDQIKGTPDYLSPEQVRSESVTPQTDIYSLGVLLYEVLTGEHPFPDLGGVQRLFKHINEPLPLIESAKIEGLDAINDLIQHATAKNPAHRFADVLELAAAFREAIADRQRGAGESIVELLTMREQEVLQQMIAGKSNKQIAEALFITPETVKWYVKQIYKKLRVRNRVQAIARARELNLLVPGEKADNHATVIGELASADLYLPEPINPYKGLHAFQSSDAQDFFGREKITGKLVKRLGKDDRFVAVVGPSGSGKSSLVKAGLIPALWRGELPGSDRWFIVEMLPGNRPLDELEVALVRVAANQGGNLREQLGRDVNGLLRVAQLILPDDGSELVLIIDQFEELFTLVEDEAERAHLLNLLYTAATARRSRVRVVVTLRADFYDRPLAYPEFGALIRDRMETVLPLTAKEVENAIANPAARVGVTFEEGLVATIADEVSYQPGALPLLQYALTELFEHREDRTLTHEAYQRIGGTVGALAKRAEEIYDELDPTGQETARQMFMRMVTLGEGAEDTRRRTSRAELEATTEKADLLAEIIDAFAASRLLSLDNDPETRTPTVEVAHEAILREWERLRTWLNESRNDIRLQRQLAQMASEWRESQRDRSFLLHGSRLETFESWAEQTQLAITQAERDYLNASIDSHEAQQRAEAERQAREAALERRSIQRLRALVGVFALAAVIAIGLTLLAVRSSNQAAIERDNAQANFIRAERIRLAAQAQIALDSGEDVRIPALLALRSLDLGYSPEADAALLTALARDFSRQTYVGHAGDGILNVRFSPDGNYLLTSSDDATARLWDTFTGEELQRFEGHQGMVTIPIFTTTGDSVLTAGIDGSIREWNMTTGEETRLLYEQDGAIWIIDLSPDGQLLAAGDEDGVVKIWDVEQMELIHTLTNSEETVLSVDFSPDGQTLATSSFDRTVRLWDVETGQEIRRFEGHVGNIYDARFSPDGETVFSTSNDGTVRVWDVESGEELQRLLTPAWQQGAAFSPNGRLLATSGTDRIVHLWDVESGAEIQQFHGHTANVAYVEFSPDGRYILSAGPDNIARLWEIQRESEPRVFARPFSTVHAESVRLAALTDNDQHIMSVHSGGIISVWNVAREQADREIAIEDAGFITDAAFSPQHDQLITVGDDETARLLDLDSEEVIQEYRGHNGTINTVAFSASSGTFITGGDDNKAILWTSDSNIPLLQFEGHSDPINDVALAPDDRFVVTASDDGTARLWDAQTGAEIRQFSDHQGAVLAVAFSPDGRFVLTGGADHTAQLWDVQSGELLQSYIGHTDAVHAVAFSSDGQMALTGSRDQTARLWNTTTGETIRHFVGHGSLILTVSMSDDSDLVVIGDLGSTYLWRTDLENVITLTCEKLSSDFSAEERTLYNIDDSSEVCA